jgi:hypothetical protein
MVLFLLAIGLLLAVHPMLAASFAVGACKPSLPSYPSISAAVSSVPPNSIVEVCPGTYSEQVTIAQPLTLKGISSGNAGQVVVTVPGSGLTSLTTGYGYVVAALVNVTATTGAVNISNITVDGTGNNQSYPPTWVVGIFYDDGSSGTATEITARNLTGTGTGVGFWAENTGATPESVTIENSSFHNIDDSAVAVQGSGSNLSVTVKGNTMQAGYDQVQFFFAEGSISGNVVNGGNIGIYVVGPTTISGNTLDNQINAGIYSFGGGLTASANKISNVPYGIYLDGGGDTYKTNTITNTTIGIEFGCNSPTVVASNTINDASTGLDLVPASFSGANNLDNVGTLRAGCSERPASSVKPSGPVPARAH